MAENRKGKDNRFYFSRGQLVLLGGAFTLTSVIIFVLGLFVGQAIEERKLMKREEPLIKIPVGPAGAAKSTSAQGRDEITFNDTSSKSAGASKEDVKSKSLRSGDAASKAEPQDSRSQVKAEAAERTASKKAEGKVPPVETARKSADAPPEGKESGAVWRAQVNAFPDDRSAKQLVERLKNKGYNAYVSEAQYRGKTWYRVSVGKYSSREEAAKIVETLRSRENYPKAFAATR
jgi:cell division septation protein DedD